MISTSWAEKFGLECNPFQDNLDADLFFRTRQHEEALLKMKIGIEERHALLFISGRSGTGKTLVSQLALRSLDQDRFIFSSVFVYPGMGKGPLLEAILSGIGVDEVARSTNRRLNRLQEEALLRHNEGKRLVIVVDEAHFLKADGLHLLRTLSNLEMELEKLVTVVLVAENVLVKRLKRPSYNSLRGRITFSMSLNPLSPAETEQFIKFRLLKCGGDVGLLKRKGYELVHRLTGGIPREINKLLYNGLLEVLVEDEEELTPTILERTGEKIGVSG
ncbi:MAG: ExeA family protein [Thermodesulfobacteriota bacterium]